MAITSTRVCVLPSIEMNYALDSSTHVHKHTIFPHFLSMFYNTKYLHGCAKGKARYAS